MLDKQLRHNKKKQTLVALTCIHNNNADIAINETKSNRLHI